MKKRVVLTAMLSALALVALPVESEAASWIRTSSGWRYQKDNTGYVTDAWEKIDNGWYCFDASGTMRTGWYKDAASNWYYFDPLTGTMRTGWVYLGADWYYLDAARGGVMATDTTIDGKYYVDTSGKATGTQANDSISNFEREVVRLVNIERNSKGLSSLTISDKLSAAADVRAGEIVNKFSHERPDGTDPWTAVKATGYNYTAVGENIAAGYMTPKEVVEGWMNSTGHRENILSPKFTEIGVGCYENKNLEYKAYWVQLFGNPR